MTRRVHDSRDPAVTVADHAEDRGSKRFAVKPGVVRVARDEKGATLILALIFIVVVSAMVTTLTSWVTSDLNNTSKFTSAQAIASAANSATEAALQNVRYQFAASTINATPPQPCWTASSTPGKITIGEQNTQLSVFCSTFYVPLSTKTRTITISTCLYSAAASAAAACAAHPLLQAVVVFNDYPTIGGSRCFPISTPTTTTTTTPTTCGTGISIESWAFGVAPPTVTNVSAVLSSACPATELVTVTGTGFIGATAVDFLPGIGDTILTGTNVSISSNTSLSACASSEMTTGTTYQVAVVTPAGTSTTYPLGY